MFCTPSRKHLIFEVARALFMIMMLSPIALTQSHRNAAALVFGKESTPQLANDTTQKTKCHVSKATFYFYAQAYQCVTGGVEAQGDISQPQPFLASDDNHTLAELAVANLNPQQSLEVGWIENPQINGDNKPHLFVYPQFSNVGNPYCYNSCGWVQTSSTYYPGMAVNVTATPVQYAIVLAEGNWWVFYNDEYIGYYPSSLWSNLTQFTWVAWWGEVATNGTHSTPCSQMGDGIFGTQPGSAVITNMLLDTGNGITNATAQSNVTNKHYYNVGNFTGHSFNYGGPGAC